MASMNGTAMKSTPGTSVATVTGIQTCWARRSMNSISSRCTSRRMAAGLLGDEPPEVAGLAVEGEHGDEPLDGVDLHERGPLAQRVDLGEPLADPVGRPAGGRGDGARAAARRAGRAPAPSE